MRKTIDDLTAEFVRSILDYDPETGLLRWKQSRCYGPAHVDAGDVAGTLSGEGGYIQISINGRLYKAHRLAFLHHNGHWPAADLDHRDGVKFHNRIGNLREATRAQNVRNTPLRRDNKSGFKGVSWHKQRGKWTARVHDGGRYVHLGLFDRVEDAAEAFRAASMRIDPEFSRV